MICRGFFGTRSMKTRRDYKFEKNIEDHNEKIMGDRIGKKIKSETKNVPCTVIEVIDGDTIEVAIPSYDKINKEEDLHDTSYGCVLHATERIRLEKVDCPEMNESGGNEAKTFTENFLKNGNVSVKIYIVDGANWGHYVKNDKYGRILGDLLVDGKSLSDELVKNGLAVYLGKNQE
ncbi:hypothetical protein MTLP_10890 [Candidatus Methanoliparum sp. LAM-1]|nr:hypothetical protein MTLP_10890 [Candidatus Methanoliparum sp. LAM-1]